MNKHSKKGVFFYALLTVIPWSDFVQSWLQSIHFTPRLQHVFCSHVHCFNCASLLRTWHPIYVCNLNLLLGRQNQVPCTVPNTSTRLTLTFVRQKQGLCPFGEKFWEYKYPTVRLKEVFAGWHTILAPRAAIHSEKRCHLSSSKALDISWGFL